MHNSRVAVPDKPKLVAPKMPVMKADDPGMTWLEIVGLVCLVAGSALFVVFAAAGSKHVGLEPPSKQQVNIILN